MGSSLSSLRKPAKRNKAPRATQHGELNLGYKHTSSSRLLSLPPEIREMIYAYVLSSPHGYLGVYSHFYTPSRVQSTKSALKFRRRAARCSRHGTVTDRSLKNMLDSAPGLSKRIEMPIPFGLPLLQTCRQIHMEAAHHLYSNNTFILPVDLFRSDLPSDPPPPVHLFYKIQYIWISVGFGLPDIIPSLAAVNNTLRTLHIWATSSHNCELKAITVGLTYDTTALNLMYSLTNGSQKVFRLWETLLKHDRRRWESTYGDKIGEMAHVKRRFEISHSKQHGLPEFLSPLVKRLWEAHGGEFWFDDGWSVGGEVLCATDGEQMDKLLEHQRQKW